MERGDRIESELEKGSETTHLLRMQNHAHTFAFAILKNPHKIFLVLTYAWIWKSQNLTIWLSSNNPIANWFMFDVPWSGSGTTGTKKKTAYWCWLWQSKWNPVNTDLSSISHHKFFSQVRSRALDLWNLRRLDFCRFWSTYSFYLFYGLWITQGFYC